MGGQRDRQYTGAVLLVSGLMGASVATVFQLIPPLHVLNHEFTQAFSVAAGIALYYISARVTRRMLQTPAGLSDAVRLSQAWNIAIAASLAAALSGFCIVVASSVAIHHCRFRDGVPFFWITWAPLSAFLCLLGLVGVWRRWGWGRRTLLLAVLIVGSIFLDFMQISSGIHITDFLIGAPLFADQRAGMAVPPVHLYQRGMLLLLTFALWRLVQWRAQTRRENGTPDAQADRVASRNQGLFGMAAFIAIACCAGSYVGMGWGQGIIRDTLSRTRTSEHFVFHYAPAGQADIRIDGIERAAEWYWTRIGSLLELQPKRRVDLFITESSAMTRELSGPEDANARPWCVILTVYDATSITLFHELTHALDTAEARNDLTAMGLLRCRLREFADLVSFRPVFFRGRAEGLAQSLSEYYAYTPEAHQIQAAALKEGTLPHADVFMGFFGFRKANENNAYNLSGSFMGFLRIHYGPDRFKRFLDSREDYLTAFGKDLSALDAEWREFLSAVPINAETRMASAQQFDAQLNTTFLDDCCPKLGAREETQAKAAERYFFGGGYDKALELYDALYASENKPLYRFQQSVVLRKMYRYSDAITVLDELLAAPESGSSERLKYLEAKQGCAMEMQDWDLLYRTQDEKASIDPNPGEDARILQTALRNPAYRSEVAKILTGRDRSEGQKLAEKLAQAYPNDGGIRHLYLTRVLAAFQFPYRGPIDPESRTRALTMLDYLNANTPESVKAFSGRLLSFSATALTTSDFDLADRFVQTILDHASGTLDAFRARMMKERIAFENAYMAAKSEKG